MEMIKLLKWREREHEAEPDRWDAETPFGTFYGIRLRADGFFLEHDYRRIGVFTTLDNAKSCAQADYGKRVRSALVRRPIPVDSVKEIKAA